MKNRERAKLTAGDRPRDRDEEREWIILVNRIERALDEATMAEREACIRSVCDHAKGFRAIGELGLEEACLQCADAIGRRPLPNSHNSEGE